MMRFHDFNNEEDDYFNEYADGIKYDLLKDRLHWQHKTHKDIYLEYRFGDDDCDFDFWVNHPWPDYFLDSDISAYLTPKRIRE